LTAMEKRLPTRDFIRLNRSVIVNLAFITSIQKTGRGEYNAMLADGKCVVVTCGLRELQERMK
jgi:DNA-binding LytR/AlgR family response regulator